MLRFAFSSPSSALRTSYSSIYLRVSQLKSKLSRSAFISRSHTSLASKLHPDVAASDADIVTVAEQSRAVVAPGTQTVRIAHALPLDLGGHLPEVEINYAEWNIAPPGAPVVFVMPSMSHSALITNAELPAAAGTRGWWQTIVGTGSAFGIDLSRYRVIAASPLGGPFGSTSPVTVSPKTGRRYRAHFPQITPGDQARAHALLLDHLKIERVHAVVGGSMGGMQALCFATLFPHRVLRCVSLCATGRTSPTTQALRAVQRALVESDPCWQSGEYKDGHGPIQGLGLARAMGTIFYRSRQEFDARFAGPPVLRSSDPSRLTPLASLPACSDNSHHHHHHLLPTPTPVPKLPSDEENWPASVALPVEFDVERYLAHAARSFSGRYDANCWLLLSRCLDLQDIGRGFGSNSDMKSAVSVLTSTTSTQQPHEVMLLPVEQDALIPADESSLLATVCQRAGVRVYCERINSIYGHDAFLKEDQIFNLRLSAFLADGIDGVHDAIAKSKQL